jgi:hypothetical protein
MFLDLPCPAVHKLGPWKGALGFQMKIGFFRGRVAVEGADEPWLWWSQTGNEFWVFDEDSDEVIRGFNPPATIYVERITEFELPEIDEEAIETIIINILKGGYLEKPGIKDSGEAVLFILVNEALQMLSEAENDETSS